MRRVAPSVIARERLHELLAGAADRDTDLISELVAAISELVVQELLEGELADFLGGRGHYQRRGEAQPRSAALIALAHALGYERKIVDPRDCGLSAQQIRARAAEMATGSWAPGSTRPAVGEMIAAVAAAASAAAAAGSVGSG